MGQTERVYFQKINQFEDHRVAVKTEAYEMHYEDSGASNVLQRRVGRVKLLPLLEGLVKYSSLVSSSPFRPVCIILVKNPLLIVLLEVRFGRARHGHPP
jgi:hypothetical protein